jgi:galactose-1-phosphate uridylyltransferase
VIPNKFAALSGSVQPTRSVNHGGRRIEGFGFHEVISDSPDHSCCMALLPDAQVASILPVYKERYHLLSMDRRVNHWHVSVIPGLTRVAGFELGSGMFINTVLLAAAAEFLRNVSAEKSLGAAR